MKLRTSLFVKETAVKKQGEGKQLHITQMQCWTSFALYSNKPTVNQGNLNTDSLLHDIKKFLLILEVS